jgi:hypothetical protein
LVGTSGPTTARPTYPKPGVVFVDTTIPAVIAWDGAAWRNLASGAIV